jgi:hypothetical protein
VIKLKALRGTTRRLDPPEGAFPDRYRQALDRTVGGAAVPYGYTILTASAGGVLINTHGPPGVGAAGLFLGGAAAGFCATALVTGQGGADGGRAGGPGAAAQGLCSGAAAAAGLALSAPLAHAIAGAVAFGLVSFTATVAYLGLGALATALIDRRGPDGPRSQPVTPATDGVEVTQPRRSTHAHPHRDGRLAAAPDEAAGGVSGV